ncbi:MAG: alpha-amylase [Alistipes sp.]|nr:alpha-amylase [Alistipes sp.]
MKKFLAYLRHSMLLAAVLLMAYGCSENEVIDGQLQDPSQEELSASSLSYTFTNEGGSQPIIITAPGSWYVSSSADWCYASLSSGANGTTELHIMAEPNPKAKERTAELTLACEGQPSIIISVTQSAAIDDPNLVKTDVVWDGVNRSEMIYQILVYSFADSNGDNYGDFQGIISKLDYIKELGAGAIWLSPIHPADSYHGYDITDYTDVHPKFGTKDDFKQLLEAAHQRGIKIYIDIAVNHTGKGHPWYTEALESYKKVQAGEGEYSDSWYYYMLSDNPALDIAQGKFPMLTQVADSKGYESDAWKDVDGWKLPETTTHRYTFTVDWMAKTVTVVPTEAEAQEANTDETVNMFLYCEDPGKYYRMYDKGDGIYELTMDFKSPWGFLIRTTNDDKNWDANGVKYGSKTGDYIAEGQVYPLGDHGGNIQFDYMKSLKVYARLFSAWMPELNYGPVATCQDTTPYKHIVQAMKDWLSMGVDGLRLDAAKHIYRQDGGPENQEFWSKFYADINAHYKTLPHSNGEDIYMVAEVFDGTDMVASYANCLPSCFNFDFSGKLIYALKNRQGHYVAKDVIELQNKLHAANPKFIDATKLKNHDENRIMNELEGNRDYARMAGVMQLTLPGRPVIYYGEELAYSGNKESDDVNVRQPMKWTRTEYAKYTGALSPVFANERSVEEQLADENSVLNAYRKFGQLRNVYSALTEKGSLTKCYDESDKPHSLAAWYREADGTKLLVMHNIGSRPIEVKLYETIDKAVAVMGNVLLEGDMLSMPAYSTVIFKVQ